jgi:phosphatidylglycerophosphatase A
MMAAASRPGLAFLFAHPAHALALGFGSGLAPRMPGTVGTLWAWVAFLVIDRWLGAGGWAMLIAAALAVGLWACTVTAQHLRTADPSSIVWDEVVAFWIVLWVLMPADLWMQLTAFVLFRYFDAAKPGPVRWADQLFEPSPGSGAPIGWRQGAGILFDDLVAAFFTLLWLALWVAVWRW